MSSVEMLRSLVGCMSLLACVVVGCDKPKLIYAPPLPSDAAAAKQGRQATEQEGETKRVATPVAWSEEKLAEETRQLNDQIKRMCEALAADDMDTFMEFIPPPMIKAMGGMAKATDAMRGSMTDRQGNRIEMSPMVPGEPTFLEGPQFEYVLVRTASELKMKGKPSVASTTTQLGARVRGERRWYFLDGSRMRRSKADMIPEFPLDYPIPEPKQVIGE